MHLVLYIQTGIAILKDQLNWWTGKRDSSPKKLTIYSDEKAMHYYQSNQVSEELTEDGMLSVITLDWNVGVAAEQTARLASFTNAGGEFPFDESLYNKERQLDKRIFGAYWSNQMNFHNALFFQISKILIIYMFVRKKTNRIFLPSSS